MNFRNIDLRSQTRSAMLDKREHARQIGLMGRQQRLRLHHEQPHQIRSHQRVTKHNKTKTISISFLKIDNSQTTI